ncbi:stress response protein ElaB [Gibbsiella greigii]
MSKNTDDDQTTLDDDLKMLSDTLEEVLAYSGDRADQAYVDIKSHAEEALQEVRARLESVSESYCARAKDAALRADFYVHEKPWQSVGIGATVGLVFGLLLARR